MSLINYILSFLLLALIYGCAPQNIIPITDIQNRNSHKVDEKYILEQSDFFVAQIKEHGLIYYDDSLNNLIQNLKERIITDDIEKYVNFNFYIVKDPTINAFALDNGNIFIHSGLICNVENEHQLAFIMAHEAAHVIKRHMLRGFINFKRKTIAYKFADIILSPLTVYSLGLSSAVVQLTIMYSINGYGREMEDEADRLAFDLFRSAGFKQDEAVLVFDQLNEVDDMGGLEYFFYSTHPTNIMRKNVLQTLINDSILNKNINNENFKNLTKELQLYNISLRINKKHYQYALYEVLNLEKSRFLDDDYRIKLMTLKGDIYQKMYTNIEDVAFEYALKTNRKYTAKLVVEFKSKQEEYKKNAMLIFNEMLNKNIAIDKAYRGLGHIAYQDKKYNEAKAYLTKYLDFLSYDDKKK